MSTTNRTERGGGGRSGRHQLFGQTMRAARGRGGSNVSRYQRQMGHRGATSTSLTNNNNNSSSSSTTGGSSGWDPAAAAAERRRRHQIIGEDLDRQFGMESFSLSSTALPPTTALLDHHEGAAASSSSWQRRGWLFQVLPTTVNVSNDASTAAMGGAERAGLDLYFCTESGQNFKTTLLYRPYFYVLPDLSLLSWASSSSATSSSPTSSSSSAHDHGGELWLELAVNTLQRWLEGRVAHIRTVYRVDLDQPNHLSPKFQRGRPMFQLFFENVSQLVEVREQVRLLVQQNQQAQKSSPWQPSLEPWVNDPTSSMQAHPGGSAPLQDWMDQPLRFLTDLREYDVPYVVRVCTDLQIRCGTWYTVRVQPDPDGLDEQGGVRLTDPDGESKAHPKFLAFDIECTKAPLKFPSAAVDEIFMISYMVSQGSAGGSQGYLIVSRSVVAQDVQDFEYTPKPHYPGPFIIYNEPNEKALLERFFAEYRRHQPQIVVTYNGDFFDWPFVEARAKHHGMDLFQMIGVEKSAEDHYRGRCSVHLDAFHWVQRDSYLPQGAQGLKAVTKYKLGYDPVEVDPEDMVRFAQERPVHMATYSVSDAVATYYLYENYVHLFIFSLCTIIPMGPEDVLRKGSGTLCETLLMVQACQKNIICPNKQVDPLAKFHRGHLLESETYIGGKVECLETGVYRSDLEYSFALQPAAFAQLMDHIDRDLTFAIQVEGGQKREDVINYDQIRQEIVQKLQELRDRPTRTEKPFVYHLDVGAMYPNIILTNRLQPSAMADDAICAACDFNQARNDCKRRMKWIWRGDYNPATKGEYDRTLGQLGRENAPNGEPFTSLPEREQATLVASRLKEYSRKAYKKTKVTEEETREDIVCMRENDFYVDTVRQFRDRRYLYKKLKKTWSKKAEAAKDAATKKQCEDRELVYDSLQVAHKCILNSFYGYVMRKGARWRSMQMAGIVTKTGADIITQARLLVEQIGRPLELDTDGIWCILPRSFPDVYTFQMKDGSTLKLEYPCVMLNADIHHKFTNHQYQTLVDPSRGIYETRSECSIFFEVDGPYRCMVLPASTEEGKLLKKRYAVFNFDGSLAELKGFELKRRGELELIKTFQSQVFERFLDGTSLVECYASVAAIANHWIDVIDTRGESLDDEELVDLISENRSMSRQVDDYGDQKGTSQTTARRLGEFLGSEIIKDKGLSCRFIISEQPYGSPVTERAIPTAIWKAEPAVLKHFLRKWLKSPGLDGDELDIRNILDWDYYMDRLGKTIQKIITIPAALQSVANPVPRVAHPAWLDTKLARQSNRFQQRDLRQMFGTKSQPNPVIDIEDIAVNHNKKLALVHSRRRDQGQDIGEVENGTTEQVVLSDNNFLDWLNQRKSTWRSLRKSRRNHTDSTEVLSEEKRQRKAVNVETFVREAALSLTKREWHIVEVREMTPFDNIAPGTSSSSGEFVVWAMVGTDSLQKLTVKVPRIFYVSTRAEITCSSNEILSLKRVEKHFPQSADAKFLYEVTVPEYVFRKATWSVMLRPIDKLNELEDFLVKVYETGTPLLTRLLSNIGAVCRLNPSNAKSKNGKIFDLADFSRVERPAEGEYLNVHAAYRRIFLYIRMNPKTNTGIVALFFASSLTKTSDGRVDIDITRPVQGPPDSLDISAKCNIWVVTPGAASGQRNITQKQSHALFKDLIHSIHENADGLDLDYGVVSRQSSASIESLRYVNGADVAFAGVNEALGSYSGPSFVLLNSNILPARLRKHISSLGKNPVIVMPYPPGPAHNPTISSLPSLNWEQPAIQLCYEAYLFMMIISFPKRIAYCRYSQIPLGNLGADENITAFNVTLLRLIDKNRALSWASLSPGNPDLGQEILRYSGETTATPITGSYMPQENVWDDDRGLVSPIFRRPGCYNSVCVDIDIHDLATASILDASTHESTVFQESLLDPNSPTGVAVADRDFLFSRSAQDETATLVYLPVIRSLAGYWLRDAISSRSLVADELLHNIYRLLADPNNEFYHPAIHQATHQMMKATFMRILSTLQSLGCDVVFANFYRITVNTKKILLEDAEEYVNFIISAFRSRLSDVPSGNDALARVTLQQRRFHSHFLFLDEYNFGTMQLERMVPAEVSNDVYYIPERDSKAVVVPSVVMAWTIMTNLVNLAGEYFLAIMSRFTRDVLKKQIELKSNQGSATCTLTEEEDDVLVDFKRNLVSKHIANTITRAVAEIGSSRGTGEGQNASELRRMGHQHAPLEFIKAVIGVLELDSDIETEVQVLKRSLYAQIGVAEYSPIAQWTKRSPEFILPDVFCMECHECRDLNLCYTGEDGAGHWQCENCGAIYDSLAIEGRLMAHLHFKCVRYQLQDIFCARTGRIATRSLNPRTDYPGGVKLEINQRSLDEELHLLHEIANKHAMESLVAATEAVLENFTISMS